MKTEAGHPARYLLLLGAGQALGFVLGAMLGWAAGTALGLDALDPAGYTSSAMLGIALIGLGGGAGVQLARYGYRRRYGDPGV